MKYRLGWLTAFTVIAIVLGVLGCLTALINTGSVLLADRIQEMALQMQQGAPNSPQADLTREMNSKMAEVTNRWQGVNIVLIALHFLFSAALFVGGIQALRLRPSGRKLLSTLFAVAVVFEIA